MRRRWRCLSILCATLLIAKAQASRRISLNFASSDGISEAPKYSNVGYPAFKDLRLRALSREDLVNITLDDLIRLRLKNPAPLLADHYAYLFSQHRDVKRITETSHGPEEIAKAFSKLREERMLADVSSSNLRSLTASIERFLKVKGKYDEDTQERVRTRWANDYYKISNRRRKEKGIVDPRTHDRAYWRERAQILRERRQEGTILPFENYLERHGIDTDGLDAAQIEAVTRPFHHKIHPARSVVSKLATYLRGKGFNDKDVDLAIGTRRRHLKKLRTRTNSARRRER